MSENMSLVIAVLIVVTGLAFYSQGARDVLKVIGWLLLALCLILIFIGGIISILLSPPSAPVVLPAWAFLLLVWWACNSRCSNS